MTSPTAKNTCAVAKHADYPEIFDTIIVGAGPAGMTAAIYAARRKMKTLMVCGTIGGQMKWASDIQNWTGVAQATGPELTNQFYAHIKRIDHDDKAFDLWVREEEKVTTIKKNSLQDKDYHVFEITTDGGEKFLTKTVVVCSGKIPRTLGIPGEKIAMRGNGLSFSATSDAPLYRDKKMAVIGGGNSAMDVALQLAKYTDDITIMTNLDHLIGEACLMDRVNENPNILIKYAVAVQEVLLDENEKVSGIRLSEGAGDSYDFDCEGIFEEIGQIPATGFVKGFLDQNDGNEIIKDKDCKTSIEGIFAAGDCTDQQHKQTIIAAGEAAVAALEAHKYIIKLKE
jgi:alkyl hydroperoxide reductase subunit F